MKYVITLLVVGLVVQSCLNNLTRKDHVSCAKLTSEKVASNENPFQKSIREGLAKLKANKNKKEEGGAKLENKNKKKEGQAEAKDDTKTEDDTTPSTFTKKIASKVGKLKKTGITLGKGVFQKNKDLYKIKIAKLDYMPNVKNDDALKGLLSSTTNAWVDCPEGDRKLFEKNDFGFIVVQDLIKNLKGYLEDLNKEKVVDISNEKKDVNILTEEKVLNILKTHAIEVHNCGDKRLLCKYRSQAPFELELKSESGKRDKTYALLLKSGEDPCKKQ